MDGFGNNNTNEQKIRNERIAARLTLFVLVVGLVDDGAVLERPQVEHADAAISTARDEDIDAVGAKAHVEDFFVVGDELCLCSQGRNVPYCAGCVDRRCDDQ